MPLREPRMELDRLEINKLLDWSGISIKAICSFVRTIPIGSNIRINNIYVYNRGKEILEDTERRNRTCYIISIWSDKIENSNSLCLFQQPIPLKFKFSE